MKSKLRGLMFFLFNCLYGFAGFLFVILSAELISLLLGFSKNISFGLLHLQVATLGAVLQGSVYFFKSLKKLAQ